MIDAILLCIGFDSLFLKLRSNFEHLRYVRMSITLDAIIGIIDLVLGIKIYCKSKKSMLIAILLIFLIFIRCIFFTAMNWFILLDFVFLVMLFLSLKFYVIGNTRHLKKLKHLVAWLSVILALFFGIFGSYTLRDQFSNLKTVVDAVYFTVTTYTTVSYGDILPVTQDAKIFTMLMVVIGIGSLMTTFTIIVIPMVQNKLKGIFNIMEKMANMKDHVIICGYTKLSKAIITTLNRQSIPYLVIEKNDEKAKELEKINATFIIGDHSIKDSLNKANMEHAKMIMCVFENDAENILAIMTIKKFLSNYEWGKNIKILTSIENDDNSELCKSIGVDKIVSPAAVVANSLLDGAI